MMSLVNVHVSTTGNQHSFRAMKEPVYPSTQLLQANRAFAFYFFGYYTWVGIGSWDSRQRYALKEVQADQSTVSPRARLMIVPLRLFYIQIALAWNVSIKNTCANSPQVSVCERMQTHLSTYRMASISSSFSAMRRSNSWRSWLNSAESL